MYKTIRCMVKKVSTYGQYDNGQYMVPRRWAHTTVCPKKTEKKGVVHTQYSYTLYQYICLTHKQAIRIYGRSQDKLLLVVYGVHCHWSQQYTPQTHTQYCVHARNGISIIVMVASAYVSKKHTNKQHMGEQDCTQTTNKRAPHQGCVCRW